MIQYLARRSGYMALILVLSSVGIFYSLRFAPGDPTGQTLNPLTIASVRAEFRHQLGAFTGPAVQVNVPRLYQDAVRGSELKTRRITATSCGEFDGRGRP